MISSPSIRITASSSEETSTGAAAGVATNDEIRTPEDSFSLSRILQSSFNDSRMLKSSLNESEHVYKNLFAFGLDGRWKVGNWEGRGGSHPDPFGVD